MCFPTQLLTRAILRPLFRSVASCQPHFFNCALSRQPPFHVTGDSNYTAVGCHARAQPTFLDAPGHRSQGPVERMGTDPILLSKPLPNTCSRGMQIHRVPSSVEILDGLVMDRHGVSHQKLLLNRLQQNFMEIRLDMLYQTRASPMLHGFESSRCSSI